MVDAKKELLDKITAVNKKLQQLDDYRNSLLKQLRAITPEKPEPPTVGDKLNDLFNN